MPGTEQPSRSDIGGAAITLMSLRDGDLVSWHLRSKLKALPIHDPKTFSLRSTISYLINISEPLPIGVVTIRTALNEIRGAAIEEYTKPDKFESMRETVAYMVNREVKSPKCTWKRHAHCLVLLARCELVERANIPGVALEFVTRTGKSAWAVHRMPDVNDILGHPVYLERNEIVAYSQCPQKLQVRPHQQSSCNGRPKLVKTVRRIAATLFA